jgi:hypothetical protein
MAAFSPEVVATLVLVVVTASLPCFLYGAWYIIETDPVYWADLTHHVKFVGAGLALTTIPVVFWMVPRLFDQLRGLAVLHAFLGVQAYALLAFGLTGIVRIFRAKRRHDLYEEYDENVLLDEIGDETFSHWRWRLRVGVFGYLIFWILAYIVGVVRFFVRYVI